MTFSLGVLMLDTRFPRIVGDVGNPQTWPFPAEFEMVRGIGVGAVVRGVDPIRLEPAFVEAALRLVERGVSAITTSCGFLVLLQERLQTAVDVPVLTSSLLQVPWIMSALSLHAKIGILSFERSALGVKHLWAAGIEPSRVVVGDVAGSAFHTTISHDLPDLDVEQAREDHVAAARRMLAEEPDIAAFVLECANMPPYAPAIREATGLPVFDITTLVGWIAAGLQTDQGQDD